MERDISTQTHHATLAAVSRPRPGRASAGDIYIYNKYTARAGILPAQGGLRLSPSGARQSCMLQRCSRHALTPSWAKERHARERNGRGPLLLLCNCSAAAVAWLASQLTFVPMSRQSASQAMPAPLHTSDIVDTDCALASPHASSRHDSRVMPRVHMAVVSRLWSPTVQAGASWAGGASVSHSHFHMRAPVGRVSQTRPESYVCR